MKIIISHDVDHLYPSDHVFRDLIFPKLWLRSFCFFLQRKIGFKTFVYRLFSIFDKRLHRIPEIINFDKENGIPSTFFFGMDNILGMSYKREKANKWIKYVIMRGMDVGVHGVEIKNIDKMIEEFNSFREVSNMSEFGIRTHYVRFDEMTFQKMSEIGYLFDTSEFNKCKLELKLPYKIGAMWEFPLYIMDGYVMKNDIEKAKNITIEALKQAEMRGIEYFTFLFHDYMFNERTYPQDNAYYRWFVDFCLKSNYRFISYKSVIKELEVYV